MRGNKFMNKIAVAGGLGNASRAAMMLKKHAPPGVSVSFIGHLKPFTKGYDLILNFSTRPGRILVLLTCGGVKVARVCGSDWHRSIIGKRLHRIMLWLSGVHVMYASEDLKKDVRLNGEVYVNPVNEDHFYPRDVPRSKDVCYYVRAGLSSYHPERMPVGATVIDGTVSYDDMPLVLSAHKKYVRYILHNAAPKLPYEALLCGCEVIVNDERLTKIPEYMTTAYQAPRWIQYLLTKTVK